MDKKSSWEMMLHAKLLTLVLQRLRYKMASCTPSIMYDVPDLQNNLISLDIIEENVFTYSLREGNMKICKGSLVSMQGVMLSNNLYQLIRDTAATGATISTPKVAEEDSTHL